MMGCPLFAGLWLQMFCERHFSCHVSERRIIVVWLSQFGVPKEGKMQRESSIWKSDGINRRQLLGSGAVLLARISHS